MYTAATFLSLCTSCSGCTITLLLPHALLVYVGRSDKKDSCGALYFKKVLSVSKEGTQPCPYHTVDFSNLSSPGRQLFLLIQKPVDFLEWFKGESSFQVYILVLIINQNKKKRIALEMGKIGIA